MITQETIKATIDNCEKPYKLMCISNVEQDLFKFTIEEKQGLPMYKEVAQDNYDDKHSDVLKKRVVPPKDI